MLQLFLTIATLAPVMVLTCHWMRCERRCLRWIYAEGPVLTRCLPYRLHWPGQWKASSQSRCCSITTVQPRCGCHGAQVRCVCSCTPCASCRPGSRPNLHQIAMSTAAQLVLSPGPASVTELRTEDALHKVSPVPMTLKSV